MADKEEPEDKRQKEEEEESQADKAVNIASGNDK